MKNEKRTCDEKMFLVNSNVSLKIVLFWIQPKSYPRFKSKNIVLIHSVSNLFKFDDNFILKGSPQIQQQNYSRFRSNGNFFAIVIPAVIKVVIFLIKKKRFFLCKHKFILTLT